MPDVDGSPSIVRRIVEIERDIRRLPKSGGGFDPNADPILIGNGVADHSGGVGEIAIGKDAQTGDASHTLGDGNIAVGLRAQAGGFLDDDDRNIAIGTDAYAGDGGSVAVGATANVTGVNGVAVGISSQASGGSAVAIGGAAHASGLDATAVGTGADAETSDSTAVGHNASTQGARDVAIGYGSNTSAAAPFNDDPGFNNIAIGFSATAGSQNGDPSCVAIGDHASATHDTSVAIGWHATTTKNHQVILGTSTEFVEIPGSGLVLTDSATGTRYLLRVTSGAVNLTTAP